MNGTFREGTTHKETTYKPYERGAGCDDGGQASLKALGNIGENLALCKYIDAGYRLICRNWRLGRTAEIDLILIDPGSGTLCFCEVKTRTSYSESVDAGLPDPSDSVRGKKRMKIKYASRVFMETHAGFEEKNVRFDVAEVYNRGGSFQVRIIKDAF